MMREVPDDGAKPEGQPAEKAEAKKSRLQRTSAKKPGLKKAIAKKALASIGRVRRASKSEVSTSGVLLLAGVIGIYIAIVAGDAKISLGSVSFEINHPLNPLQRLLIGNFSLILMEASPLPFFTKELKPPNGKTKLKYRLIILALILIDLFALSGSAWYLFEPCQIKPMVTDSSGNSTDLQPDQSSTPLPPNPPIFDAEDASTINSNWTPALHNRKKGDLMKMSSGHYEWWNNQSGTPFSKAYFEIVPAENQHGFSWYLTPECSWRCITPAALSFLIPPSTQDSFTLQFPARGDMRNGVALKAPPDVTQSGVNLFLSPAIPNTQLKVWLTIDQTNKEDCHIILTVQNVPPQLEPVGPDDEVYKNMHTDCQSLRLGAASRYCENKLFLGFQALRDDSLYVSHVQADKEIKQCHDPEHN